MSDYTATYLNDHLAGSVAALDLLDHLAQQHAGTDLADFFVQLHADITADRDELTALMARLNVPSSRVRKAVAWVAEKFARLKMRLDDPDDGPLRLLESLEAVAVGIEGTRALWRALGAASELAPSLRGPNYARLERRAEEQRDRLEPLRLDAARAALTRELLPL